MIFRSEKHTHVFDDDSDYYCSVNPWLTLDEREKCKEIEEDFFNKKNESRLNKKINLKIDGKLGLIFSISPFRLYSIFKHS